MYSNLFIRSVLDKKILKILHLQLFVWIYSWLTTPSFSCVETLNADQSLIDQGIVRQGFGKVTLTFNGGREILYALQVKDKSSVV